MQTVTQTPGASRVLSAESLSLGRRPNPTKFWAGAGAAVILVQIYVLGSWISSGRATPTPDGPTPIPTWMQNLAYFWQGLGVTLFAVVVYRWIIRPWRAERRIPFDGMMILVWIQVYFLQDPIINYFQNWYTYNSAMLNWGSWTSDIPGWLSPNGHLLAEPPLFSIPAYVCGVIPGTIFACWVMRQAKVRRPQLGTVGLVLLCFGLMCVLDLALELAFVRTGMYSYAGAMHGWTLWEGHYYQFPIYETPIWAAAWTGFACLRYFRNDRGQTVAERGLDDLRLSRPRRAVCRFLALVGIANAIFLVYNLPIQYFALRADSWPQDVLSRSYLTNGLCGPGTTYGCSGDQIPIPRRGSARIGPDGELVPAGFPVNGTERRSGE